MRPSAEKDFVHTLDGARTFAAAIGMHSLNTGVLLDSFHWHTSGGTRKEIEHLDHHEVVGVHISDAVAGRATVDQRALVGETGVVDISGFLTSLRAIGYLGPLTVALRNADIRPMTLLKGPTLQTHTFATRSSPDAAAAKASAALDHVLANTT
jgi:sugar phosphate isomerase/epimerase